MNVEHPQYAEWDAAYVLGALSTSDRRLFEAHLAECALCRAAVAELAPTVGLLSRVSADAVTGREDGPAAAGPAALISLARERRRRRRRTWWIAAAAAVALVIPAAVGIGVWLSSGPSPTASFALEQVQDVSLEASVRLTDVAWGTRVDLECRYPAGGADAPPGGWVYVLAVIGADGSETVSTWRAGPGSVSNVSGATAVAADEIRAVEIRSESGEVLMRRDLPAE